MVFIGWIMICEHGELQTGGTFRKDYSWLNNDLNAPAHDRWGVVWAITDSTSLKGMIIESSYTLSRVSMTSQRWTNLRSPTRRMGIVVPSPPFMLLSQCIVPSCIVWYVSWFSMIMSSSNRRQVILKDASRNEYHIVMLMLNAHTEWWNSYPSGTHIALYMC